LAVAVADTVVAVAVGMVTGAAALAVGIAAAPVARAARPAAASADIKPPNGFKRLLQKQPAGVFLISTFMLLFFPFKD
jgi:hypothetical protein